ncbi:hypothetical protein [uncultured Microbulbifer sp.]|uniref:hypothetical protein n=1 Tax=uncultured Microbulbifer sp. TaxID=348147 RepID=UPI002603FBE9|nr:hypothetical protein [uncultured Microbulbifer sp.]
MRKSPLALIFATFSVIAVEDPRIPFGDYSDQKNVEIQERVNNLAGSKKKCFDKYLDDYQVRVYRFCEASDLGSSAVGGCEHIAGMAWHTAVIEVALESCASDT